VPLARLCISPQSGFSSNNLGNPITIDDEKRKLELVVKVVGADWSNA
jgi:5-methyltetrahydropteroyltriglutamate--homocysteine methyltransferase